MFKYSVYVLAEAVSRAIPRPFAYWLSLRIADAYFFCDRRGREAVMDNLRHVLTFGGAAVSERELRLAARRTFQHFGKYLVEFFTFARLTPEQIRELVAVEHREYLEKAVAAGRGVIVVTAHLGNWELGGAVMAGLGYPLNVVTLQQTSAKLNEFFQHHRQRRGMAIIPLGHAVPQLIRALRRKECVALLADRDYSQRTDFSPLFGAAACLPRGPVWLAEKTGALVLPGFMLRKENDTFELRFHPPIDPTGLSAEQIRSAIGAVLEDSVARNPHQWFMFERVWNGQSYGREAGKASEQ